MYCTYLVPYGEGLYRDCLLPYQIMFTGKIKLGSHQIKTLRGLYV